MSLCRGGMAALALLAAAALLPRSAIAEGGEQDPIADTSAPLTVDDCVAIALGNSAQVDKAEAKVKQYQARLREVQSIFYPKLMGLAILAPMFGVDATFDGNGVLQSYDRDYNITAWGPYTHLEAILAQPFYTFGRAKAGRRAASALVDVERARLREARHMVTLEVHRFYYMHLFASSMLPSLNNATEILAAAQTDAQDMYDQATGDVTKVDLMKLEYAGTELSKMLLVAGQGSGMALSALKHTMGMDDSVEIELADRKLPRLASELEIEPLPDLLLEASIKRPEWAQLDHGKEAALAWKQAERLADAPVLAVAGQIRADWAPSRSDADSPYYNDAYNQLNGGVGIAIQFDIDPAKSRARADIAEFTHEEVEAMERFASTGLPLQLKKAYQDVELYYELTRLSADGARATKKWMTFAAAGYTTGTTESKDLLEGIAAYMKGKASHYENLSKYHIARAELEYAIGRD